MSHYPQTHHDNDTELYKTVTHLAQDLPIEEKRKLAWGLVWNQRLKILMPGARKVPWLIGSAIAAGGSIILYILKLVYHW